ncbi:hypothetical protein [Sphingomonas sp. URHD0057]|uniref:hypothetical protein n=1 Tax=Sphingomonas sp. URHD0057 TaxID=1380389 RepID=UPI00049003D8|nr:hypothetical protein [Sphingomonas sp. URHD0057]
MSSYTSFGAGGATQPLNPPITYEPLGYGATGTLISVPGAGANVKGAYTAIGATSSAWCGFELDINSPNSASNRYLLDIRIGGATVILPNLFVQGGSQRIYLPLQVPSGTLIEARVQCPTTSASLKIAISGHVASASLPPGFAAAVDIGGADTTNTLASTVDVAAASSQVWTQLLAATSEAYGALLMSGSYNGTVPATAQTATMAVATGAAAAEVQIGKMGVITAVSNPTLSRAARLLELAIPSGTRLSGAFQAAAPGTDNFRFGLHGFK